MDYGSWVFNATFNNLSVRGKLYHTMLYTTPWSRFELITSVVIGTDCIGSYKSNNHMITATTAPWYHLPFVCHNISEILLKVALNTIKQTNNQIYICTVHIFKMKFIFMVIGTDCIGSYKSNNHMITATTAPWYHLPFVY
jgi:hypothetical protein